MRFFVLCSLCVSILFCVGCAPQTTSSKARYAAAAMHETTALTEVGGEWGAAMQPWLMGKSVDLDAAETAQEHLGETMKRIRLNIGKLDAPSDPKSQEFKLQMDTYLAWQAEMIGEFAEFVDTARQENPASPETRQRVLERMLALNDEELAWKKKLNDLGQQMGVTIRE